MNEFERNISGDNWDKNHATMNDKKLMKFSTF